jgi:hypothetical protein
MTTYTRDYFIAKFEAIPEDKWCTDSYEFQGRHCALGHCGLNGGNDTPAATPEEAGVLLELFREIRASVTDVNDGLDARYRQDTPKQRILAALREVSS